MVVCPVCEHAQAGGSECEVCGRRLVGAPDAGPPAPPLDGLEATLQPSVPAPPPELVPGLEPTGAAPVPAPDDPRLAELEFTCAAPVEVLVTAVPDVERIGDDVPAGEPTPYSAVVVCRYCRTETVLGARLCEHCGMRLPTAPLPAAAPVPEVASRLCSCGTPIRGSLCPACGARTTSDLT